MHEAQLHEHNSFLTLTYDDDHLPPDGGLRYRDFQLFMKRVRKHKRDVRFYMCGEYGETTKRPHYHAALFNFQWPDLEPLRRSGSGQMLYTSTLLCSLWEHGHSSIGELTRESAAYIARYVIKKQSKGPLLNQSYHYTRVDADTGEVFDVSPEFTRMSLKPGIGAKWLEQFHTDVYPQDRVNTNGRLRKPPRYYDKRMEVINPDTLVTVSERRYRRAISQSEDNTSARLATKETIAKAKQKFYKRTLE